MWNVFGVIGPFTNKHVEGWHSKMKKIARKPHLNIYKLVSLFKAEQAATEVSLQHVQLASGGLATQSRRKYRIREKRIRTVKDNLLMEIILLVSMYIL